METDDPGLVGRAIDGIAIKPREHSLEPVASLPVSTITVDFEGRDAMPPLDALATLGQDRSVRVTVPVRAQGFDPLGEDEILERIPEQIGIVLVAGNPAYLSRTELDRAIAPRIGAALGRFPNAWIGTEGIERIALATGNPQYMLLSGTTERAVRGLRDVGFDGKIAVYAPTVLSEDPDEILDAVGDYVARRRPVARTLPGGAPTDHRAAGDVRKRLLNGATQYGLVGDRTAIEDRIESLRMAGVDTIVAYPATDPSSLVR